MQLPLFPLQTVLFPGGRLPLRVFEQRYLSMVKDAIANDSAFGVCAIALGDEVGGHAAPHRTGTLVQILEWDMPETGIFHILTEGVSRFRIDTHAPRPDGLLLGEVTLLDAEPACPVPETLQLAVEILRHIVDEVGAGYFSKPRYDDAVWVSYRLAELLPIPLPSRQQMLESYDTETRLRTLTTYLKQQIN